MRVALGLLAVVVVQIMTIVSFYYLRTNLNWAPVRSDLVAFYIPTVLAALVVITMHVLTSSQASRPSIISSVFLGGGVAIVGLLIGLGIGITLWGS